MAEKSHPYLRFTANGPEPGKGLKYMDSTIPQNLCPVYPAPVAQPEVRAKLYELLGLPPTPPATDFEATPGQEDEAGLRIFHLTCRNSLGESIPGIALIPHSDTPLPGVVCLPGTSGNAARVTHPHFRRLQPEGGPLLGWGRELARRGFAILSLTLKGTESRCTSIDLWHSENKLLAPYGRTQMGILAEETLLGARVLRALGGVNPARIGLTGMSLGGNATWYAMALDPSIAAAVPVCGGVGSMARVIHGSRINQERHSAYFFIPHMLRSFDHAEIVAACIAPRPFLMISPTRDEDMPRAGVDELIPVVSEAYKAAGHPDRFEVRQPAGNHQFLVEYFEWMVDWFGKHL